MLCVRGYRGDPKDSPSIVVSCSNKVLTTINILFRGLRVGEGKNLKITKNRKNSNSTTSYEK